MDYYETKRWARTLYSGMRKNPCPKLDNIVVFNNIGFRHLIWKGGKHRSKKDPADCGVLLYSNAFPKSSAIRTQLFFAKQSFTVPPFNILDIPKKIEDSTFFPVRRKANQCNVPETFFFSGSIDPRWRENPKIHPKWMDFVMSATQPYKRRLGACAPRTCSHGNTQCFIVKCFLMIS